MDCTSSARDSVSVMDRSGTAHGWSMCVWSDSLSFSRGGHGGGGSPAALRKVDALALQHAVHEPPHFAETAHLRVQLGLLLLCQLLPAARGGDAGAEAVQQVAHLIQTKP